MDPNETLALLLNALAEQDDNAAFEHAENLERWLFDGGFHPSLSASGGELLGLLAGLRDALSRVAEDA